MSCEYGNTRLDDYFDHQLNAAQQVAFLAHCRRCASCRAAVDQHTQYLVRLKQFKLSVPAPESLPRTGSAPGDRIAAFAARAQRRPSPWPLRVAAAIATCAIGIGAYYGLRPETAAQQPGDIWSKVNIVIQVPVDLNDAKLTVSLPQGVYVQGYDGMQTLAWNADFAQGTNALELPVFVDRRRFDSSMPQYLDATLEYQGASKTFEFLVDVEDTGGVTL